MKVNIYIYITLGNRNFEEALDNTKTQMMYDTLIFPQQLSFYLNIKFDTYKDSTYYSSQCRKKAKLLTENFDCHLLACPSDLDLIWLSVLIPKMSLNTANLKGGGRINLNPLSL